ncbi:MAG: putative rane protein [Acidobacteriota bacterium]|jgi:putative membrane protein|nr:putative rane protein [Acidobacteriota bacterium]
MSKNTISGVTLMLAACALFAVVVGARTTSVSQNSNMTHNDNMHAGHGSMKMTADQKFAMEAAMGGQMEVELGKLAAQKGASDEVRQFGQHMVDDHSKANEDLMQVASGKSMTLPTALSPKMQMEMQKLSAMSGEKFDKEYVKMMVKDHKEDVAAFQKEASGGMDADIKSFATRTLPTLQEHLRMIQRISDKMMLRKSGNLKNMNSNMNSNM